MTPEELDTGRQLSAAGSAGPWDAMDQEFEKHVDVIARVGMCEGWIVTSDIYREPYTPVAEDEADARLIAWLGTHRDALIAAAEERYVWATRLVDEKLAKLAAIKRAEDAEAERDALTVERDRLRAELDNTRRFLLGQLGKADAALAALTEGAES